MKDRLESILQHYKLSSSKLAEMIDVQRSGISHILSGRNNPSYDFLVSILHAFPEINANWLLTGSGNMIETDEELPLITEKDTNVIASTPGEKTDDDNLSRPLHNELQMTADSNSYKSKHTEDSHKSIDKIIILYADGKFNEYRQE